MLGLGNSITVSRKPWDPLDISGMELWFKNGDNVAVGLWGDSSGNGNDAEQATSGNQAAVAEGGLDFDGTDDYYDLASTITFAQSQPWVCAFVVKIETLGSNALLSAENNEYINFTNVHKIGFNGNDPDVVGTRFVVTNGFPSGVQYSITIVRDSSNVISVYKNGVELTAEGTSANVTNDRGFEIKNLGSRNDASYFFDGIMYEVMLYKAAVTTGEIADLNSYLVSKFSL